MTTCPYCDGGVVRGVGRYYDCDNGHTFHVDDWDAETLREGVTA